MDNRTTSHTSVHMSNRVDLHQARTTPVNVLFSIGQLTMRAPGILSAGQYQSHYYQPSSARLSHLGLDTRDLDILVTAADCQLINTHQLQRIHFTNQYKSKKYAERACRGTLLRLWKQRMLNRERRVGGKLHGSHAYIYSIGENGAQLLSHADRALHAYTYNPVDNHNDHTLEIAEFYTKLREAHNTGKITLLELMTEQQSQRVFDNATQVLYPDMSLLTVRYSDPYPVYSWVIEWDRATEHRAEIEQKLRQYIAYYRSKVEQQIRGVFPTVLWVVPSYERKQEIEQRISELGEHFQALFMVELEEAALEFISNPLGESPTRQKLAV